MARLAVSSWPPDPVPVEGMLEPALLLLLLERPTNGYALLQQLADRLVAGRVHVGRVYETLSRLEERGFIEEFESTGRQKNYRVTLTGRGRLKHWVRGLEQSAAKIAALTERAKRLEDGGRENSRALVSDMRRSLVEDKKHEAPRRQFAKRRPKTHQRRKLVTYVIAEPCIGTKDRSCVDVCPVDCIHDDGEVDKMLYINPEECIDRGACEPACPVTAIFVDYDVPEQWAGYGEVNSLWFKDKEAARGRVDELLAASGS